MEDQGRIKRVFRESDTLLVTPEKVYDFSNDEDDLQSDMKGLFAKQEFKLIKKRMQRGKKLGARKGFWTNGKPPYPYIYNKDTKLLEVDESKRQVYRMVIEMSLQGRTAREISWELNKLGIKSPGGKLWSEAAVYRLSHDETHMGKIITNKTEGSGHKHKKTKPLVAKHRESWIIVMVFMKNLR